MKNLIFSAISLTVIASAQPSFAECLIAPVPKRIQYKVRNWDREGCKGVIKQTTPLSGTDAEAEWRKAWGLAEDECKVLQGGTQLKRTSSDDFDARCLIQSLAPRTPYYNDKTRDY